MKKFPSGEWGKNIWIDPKAISSYYLRDNHSSATLIVYVPGHEHVFEYYNDYKAIETGETETYTSWLGNKTESPVYEDKLIKLGKKKAEKAIKDFLK